MRRYLLDTGIAGCYLDRRRGVFERARSLLSLPKPDLKQALGPW
jgi:hypothetical protein